jgi:hypothetical protein
LNGLVKTLGRQRHDKDSPGAVEGALSGNFVTQTRTAAGDKDNFTIEIRYSFNTEISWVEVINDPLHDCPTWDPFLIGVFT